MKDRSGQWLAPATVLLSIALLGVAPERSDLTTGTPPPRAQQRVLAHLRVQVSGADEQVSLVRRADDRYRFVLSYDDGSTRSLSPLEFARLLDHEQGRLRWWNRFLNVSSAAGIAWVALGLLGQILFTGRMLIQWLVSERRRRSVVPPVFWWLSLGGASMLLTYFVWRRDVVGVLGQTAGFIIYARNLWLIHRTAADASAGAPSPPSADGRGPDVVQIPQHEARPTAALR